MPPNAAVAGLCRGGWHPSGRTHTADRRGDLEIDPTAAHRPKDLFSAAGSPRFRLGEVRGRELPARPCSATPRRSVPCRHSGSTRIGRRCAGSSIERCAAGLPPVPFAGVPRTARYEDGQAPLDGGKGGPVWHAHRRGRRRLATLISRQRCVSFCRCDAGCAPVKAIRPPRVHVAHRSQQIGADETCSFQVASAKVCTL